MLPHPFLSNSFWSRYLTRVVFCSWDKVEWGENSGGSSDQMDELAELNMQAGNEMQDSSDVQ